MASTAIHNHAHAGAHGPDHPPSHPPSYAHPPIETTTDRIIATAAENSELLVTLASTSEAPSALQASTFALRSHRGEYNDQKSKSEEAREDSEKASAQSQKYKDSRTGRRYAYMALCLAEKFQAKMEETERAHTEALQTRREAEERLAGLKKNLDLAEAKRDEDDAVTQVHQKSHEQLDKLYERVFRNATPDDYPEQERLKEDYSRKYAVLVQAKEGYYAFERRVRVSGTGSVDEKKRVRESLRKAAKDAEEAREALELARERVYEEVAGFGQSVSDAQRVSSSVTLYLHSSIANC